MSNDLLKRFPKNLTFEEFSRVIEYLKKHKIEKQKEYNSLTDTQQRCSLEKEMNMIEGEVLGLKSALVHLKRLNELEQNFFFKKDDTFEQVNIYQKGVNMFKGKEQPIGFIKEGYSSLIVVVDEVDLTKNEWFSLLNALEKKYKTDTFDIRATRD